VLSLLADAPALPLHEAGKYVAGAYVVFLVLLVVYVAIMAAKLQRIERELRELAGFAETRAAGEKTAPEHEEVGA
jgi:type II secretory pathway component PulM